MGGDLAERARVAVSAALCGSSENAASIGQLLLRDIAGVFARRDATWLSTKDILRDLRALDDAPWSTSHDGQPMTTYMLAKRLRQYGIKPGQKRDGNAVTRGYARTAIDSEAKRYAIASVVTATSATTATPEGKACQPVGHVADTRETISATPAPSVPRRESDVADVADVAPCSDATAHSIQTGAIAPVTRWPSGTQLLYRASLLGSPELQFSEPSFATAHCGTTMAYTLVQPCFADQYPGSAERQGFTLAGQSDPKHAED
jgi:hypothetical protein